LDSEEQEVAHKGNSPISIEQVALGVAVGFSVHCEGNRLAGCKARQNQMAENARSACGAVHILSPDHLATR
jgi:hypothetical protein